jgi:hypothetical protein
VYFFTRNEPVTTKEERNLRSRFWKELALEVGAAVEIAMGNFAWQKSISKTAGPIRVKAQPQPIWVETSDAQQPLNFDVSVENLGTTRLGSESIELSVANGSANL